MLLVNISVVTRQPCTSPNSSSFAHQQKACNSRCERSRREPASGGRALLVRRRVLSFRDDNQGANPIRVASPTSKSRVILGANFRGEDWRVAVGLCFPSSSCPAMHCYFYFVLLSSCPCHAVLFRTFLSDNPPGAHCRYEQRHSFILPTGVQ